MHTSSTCTLRVSLIKKLFYKLSNQQVIPSWGEILIYVLKLYGFDPKTLFRTLGIQDVAIVIKILKNQGLQTLSSLFSDIQQVNLLFQREANIKRKHRKERAKSKTADIISSSKPANKPYNLQISWQIRKPPRRGHLGLWEIPSLISRKNPILHYLIALWG